MEGETEEINSLEARHRKEKKELQAQIQALKKTVKGDKKKKKEITAEIIRLETELETRHSEEIDNVKNAQPETGDMEEQAVIVDGLPKVKVSKAQKRRDKKSQQEKERELQIKLQEKENIHGPRNTETLEITTKLKERQLKIYPIPSDGDCLYKAVSHQLQFIRQQSVPVEELRENVANYIRQNREEFLPFMSNPDTCEVLNDVEFDEYCKKVANTKMWGGQLEVRALSNYLKCPIQIVQAMGPNSINQGEEFNGPPLVITYHRHIYKLGEHYNSTDVLIEDGEQIE